MDSSSCPAAAAGTGARISVRTRGRRFWPAAPKDDVEGRRAPRRRTRCARFREGRQRTAAAVVVVVVVEGNMLLLLLLLAAAAAEERGEERRRLVRRFET